MTDAMTVELVEITADTLREVLLLDVEESQRDLVASNAVSIAQAYFDDQAWFRAIHGDGQAVGFVMLRDQPDAGFSYVWRFMIDHRFQNRGYGAAAMQRVIERARSIPGVARVLLSYADRPGNAGPFYARLGFRPTGERDEVEVELALDLSLDQSAEQRE